MRVVLLADTHIRDGSGRVLDDRIEAAAANADAILHAGDVTGRELLDHLERLAPVHAVLGNNDDDIAGLPAHLTLDLDGVVVTLLHDGGPRHGRPARLARRFPESDLIVLGHSHMPEDVTVDGGPRLFNAGSPTQRRRAPTRTFGLLETRRGRVLDLHHVHLT
jgi:putative phosphoesterase